MSLQEASVASSSDVPSRSHLRLVDPPPPAPEIVYHPEPWRKYTQLRGLSMASVTDRKARELVRDYGRLVHHIVARTPLPEKTNHSPLDREDMLAIGHAILIQAWVDYDSSRGMKFSSWAGFQIQQRLQDIVRDARGISRGMEIKAWNGIPVDYSSIPQILCTLDAPLDCRSEDSDRTRLDTVASDVVAPDEDAEQRADAAWLKKEMRRALNRRERHCMKAMLEGATLSELGEKFGCSRQRIEQIVKGAVEKLQRARRRRSADLA